MTREELMKAVEAAKLETKTALETVYNALNVGQQQKLLKDEQVKALFELYDVKIEED